MGRKICPICDSRLEKGNFCQGCKRWIKNPVYINADFYLNERHPEVERDCEYHSGYDKLSAAGGKSFSPRTSVQAHNSPDSRKAHLSREFGPYGKFFRSIRPEDIWKKKGQGRNFSLFFILIVIYIMINVLVAFFGILRAIAIDVISLIQ